MQVDPNISSRALPDARAGARRVLYPDEVICGLFAVTRLRRPVTILAVTDRRLLTLGPRGDNHPVVDDLDLREVTEARVERVGVLRYGDVVVQVSNGVEERLGSLGGWQQEKTFSLFESVFEEAHAALMKPPAPPLLPLQGPARTGGIELLPAEIEAAGPGDPDLVHQLTELGKLHQQGMLTDEEFSAAKARVLGQS